MVRNSDRIEVSATIAKKLWRRRTDDTRPEKAFVGGARRIERRACCGELARSWYGLRTAMPLGVVSYWLIHKKR